MIAAKDKLKEIRKKHGYNQKQVAEMIGVSAGAICRWEKGEREISDWTIKAYSRAFNVSEKYFTSESPEEEPDPTENPSIQELNDQEKRLLSYFRKLDAMKKEKYLKRISEERSVSKSDTEE